MKCWHYEAKNKKDKANCPNCRHWSGKRCKDEQLLRKRYAEGKEFDTFDRMMRSNRGVRMTE